MMERIPIEYGSFTHLPRQITFQSGDEWFLLCSDFDEEKDEYSDAYDVYLLPFRSKDDFEAYPNFWMPMASAVHLGQILVTEIGLDETRRRSIHGVRSRRGCQRGGMERCQRREKMSRAH